MFMPPRNYKNATGLKIRFPLVSNKANIIVSPQKQTDISGE